MRKTGDDARYLILSDKIDELPCLQYLISTPVRRFQPPRDEESASRPPHTTFFSVFNFELDAHVLALLGATAGRGAFARGGRY